LPEWLQPISWALSPTYVFEGLRAIILDQEFRADLMLKAFALNLVYLAAGLATFVLIMRNARKKGALISVGE
jgi:ABC-2 type transport system permease protein